MQVFRKMKSNAWRIEAQSHILHGPSTGTLLNIVDSWILCHLHYGAGLWIFQAWPDIRLDKKPKPPYCSLFKEKILPLYRYLMRKCSAARDGTSDIAIHVRMGRMPIHYQLAFQTLCDFHGIIHNHSAPEMKRCFTTTANSTTWNSSLFFKPCLDNLHYFRQFVPNKNLLNITSQKRFKTTLRKAMFNELTQQWTQLKSSRHTFNIIPTWNPHQHPSVIISKAAEGVYLRSCYTQNDTNTYNQKINPSCTARCRFCNSSEETITHWFLECPSFEAKRNKHLTSKSNKLLTLSQILTEQTQRPNTIKFILDTICKTNLSHPA